MCGWELEELHIFEQKNWICRGPGHLTFDGTSVEDTMEESKRETGKGVGGMRSYGIRVPQALHGLLAGFRPQRPSLSKYSLPAHSMAKSPDLVRDAWEVA